MSWLVILSYELYNASQTDFAKVNRGLKSLGLINEIISEYGTTNELPMHTFAGQFSKDADNTSTEIVNYIKENTKKIFEEAEVEGKMFVAAGENWSWGELVT